LSALSLRVDVYVSLLKDVGERSISEKASPSGDVALVSYEVSSVGGSHGSGGGKLVHGDGAGQTDHRYIIGESTGSALDVIGMPGDEVGGVVSWASLALAGPVVESKSDTV